MSAIAWTTVRDAIQSWVKNSSGLAGDHVIWHGQSAARPVGLHVELKLRVLPHRGIDPVRYTYDAGANTFTQKVYGSRAAELTMTCWQGAPQTSAGSSVPATSSWPTQIVDDVLSSARLDGIHAALHAAGVGVGANEVISLDGDVIEDVYFEARCIATVRLHLSSEVSYAYPVGEGWIQVVNAAGLPGDLESIAFSSVGPGALAQVTYDAISAKYVPADNEEWAYVSEAAADTSGGPSHLYTGQGSSDVTAARDEISLNDLTQSGVLMSYNQSVSGWARKAMTLPDGAASNGWQNTAIVNLASESALLLLYVDITGAAAANRSIAGFGAGNDHRYVGVTSTQKIWASDLASTNFTFGTAAIPSGVFPVVLQLDRANSVFKVYTSEEVITVTYVAPSAGGAVFKLGDAIGIGAAPCAYLYGALWRGASAEKSAAKIRTLLQTLRWTVAW